MGVQKDGDSGLGHRIERLAARAPLLMPSVHRTTLPQPPAPREETQPMRWRRKLRSYLLKAIDRTILAFYKLIAWLDKEAPVERRYYRVAIFGSSRIQPEDEIYRRVRELARRLSFMGCDIVTGGGPGLMQAANEGAAGVGHGARSTGIRTMPLLRSTQA